MIVKLQKPLAPCPDGDSYVLATSVVRAIDIELPWTPELIAFMGERNVAYAYAEKDNRCGIRTITLIEATMAQWLDDRFEDAQPPMEEMVE